MTTSPTEERSSVKDAQLETADDKPKMVPLEISEGAAGSIDSYSTQVHYRLYKRRFVGGAALCLLNCIGGMNWLWFSAISLDTANAFNLSVTKVNWLSNVVNVVYLPVSFLLPWIIRKFGLRRSCVLAALILVLASWLRVAGTAHSLGPKSAYALLFIGQLLAGLSQPFYQVLAPKYSETWFGLQGRVTATMLISLMNPVGGALAQLLAPAVGSPRTSVLVIGIISTVVAPVALFLGDRPPTPPKTLRSALGLAYPEEKDRAMTLQERIDFGIMTWGFGVLVAIISAFTILVAQVYAPYGYNSDASGFLGAAVFIAGLVGAIITAPLFDRVFTHHLARTLHVVIPIIGAAWLGLAWAVKAHGLVPSYVLLAIAGFGSFMLLPVALELACEVTRNAEFSSAILWFTANALTVFFVLISDDLRASATANPPLNLNKQLILQGAFAISLAPLVIFIKGKQVRREQDERERLRDTGRAANGDATSPA
ncbi:hypothetical protein FRC04_004241 [Tulasnella sp. 424]|nr:hypothetical protein FRC04_004241 [Tulasnella sp. 424]KAG8979368.1 hypothetical protein FRC05_008352 [Tulasnella sp. 425]